MAGLLFIEGFETFGANGDTGSGLQVIIEQKWTDVDLHTSAKLSDSAYENQGLCLDAVSSDSGDYIRITHHASPKELIVGWAWYTGALTANDYIYQSFSSGSGTQIKLQSHDDGSFHIYYASGDYITSTGLVSSNTWHYIELKYEIADSPDGYWKLYVDGSLVASETGLDTWTNNLAQGINLHCWIPKDTGTRWDDIYIYDNTGDIQEPYGPVKIRALLPDGDDTTEWTSTGANHYDQVNDIPTDTANYVESDVVDDVDLFTFEDSTDPNDWPILGVQLNVYAAVTDVGLFTLNGIAESNSTQEIVNEVIIDNTGDQYTFVFENDPDTSNAWTVNGINDAIFGVEVG